MDNSQRDDFILAQLKGLIPVLDRASISGQVRVQHTLGAALNELRVLYLVTHEKDRAFM